MKYKQIEISASFELLRFQTLKKRRIVQNLQLYSSYVFNDLISIHTHFLNFQSSRL